MELDHIDLRFPHAGCNDLSGAKLVRWLVPDGGLVSISQPWYEAMIDGVIRQQVSVLNGYVQHLVTEGMDCRDRPLIARIRLVDDDRHTSTFPLYLLHGKEMDALDALRGDVPRGQFARDSFLNILGLPPDEPDHPIPDAGAPDFPDARENQVTFPLMSKGTSAAKFVRWLVPDGGHAYLNQWIYELETDGKIMEVPSMATGYLRHIAEEGTIYQAGDTIGGMTRHEDNERICTTRFSLRHSREMHVFGLMRRESGLVIVQFIRESFLSFLGLPPDEEGKGPGETP